MNRIFALLILALLPCAATAQTVTLEKLLSAPFPSEISAAPTAARVAWIQTERGVCNLFVAAAPEYRARQLTKYSKDDGQRLSAITWSSDAKTIVYIRGDAANRAGENPNPTSDPAGAEQALWRVAVDGGDPVRIGVGSGPAISPRGDQLVFLRRGQIYSTTLTDTKEAKQLLQLRGSASSLRWSPDGSKFAFVSNRGDHSFIGVYEIASKDLRWLAASVDRDGNPEWSPDGTRIAFTRYASGQARSMFAPERSGLPWSIVVADVATSKSKVIWRADEGAGSVPQAVVAENQLLWGAGDRIIFPWERDGWLHLYSVAANGSAATLLTPGAFEVEYAALSPDRREVLFNSNQDDIDRRHLWRVPVGGGKPVSITSGKGIEWMPQMTSDGKTIAYLRSDAKRPAQAVIQSINGGEALGEMRGLSAIPADFPSASLVEPQAVMITAADGMQIHAQLFLPKNPNNEKRPAAIFFHGGSRRQMLLGFHYRDYYHNTYAMNQFMASQGYVALSVNYRSGTGYGLEFREALNYGATGASEFHDVMGAGLYLRSRGDVDGKRIGIWGGSYGGYLTAMGLSRASDLFAAGVDIHGVHDWATRVTAGGGGDDRDAVKIARESSPMYAVEKWRSPVLLVHGDDDRNVAFNQTTELARRLREQKVEFEQLIIPDEIHDFLLHRSWVRIFNASFDFLERKLKNAQPRQTSFNPGSPSSSPSTQPTRVDLLIRNGRVFDGSGANEIKADLGITGDRITFIGDAAKANITATRTLDATGLIVAPGFIDPHTHADEDLSDPQRKANLAFLLQGVTTVVIGSDGRSPLPLSKKLDALNKQGIGTNAVHLVGHGSVRGAVLGQADVQPNAEQLEKMKALVKQGMADGAFGMSTGLYYAPGSYSKTEEVIELAKVVAAQGGIYDTHQRDESSYSIGLLGSIAEVIRIGREAKLPVHISHIKALGVDVWGQSKDAIALIEKARAEGVNVTANQYPYTASGTSLTASLVPRWAEAGGNAELLKRIEDPAVRPRLVKEMEDNLRRRGGANSLLITSSRNRAIVGQRLDAIAKAANKPPVEAALDVIKTGGAGVASFNMSEPDIEAFMKMSWVMTGSDGSGGHPRKYGTYPRKLHEYVFNRHVISLPRMIQASSAQVAETFGIRQRGKLAIGNFADVIVFDEKTVNERATYEQPEQLAVGMKFILVNGKLAVEDGKYTGTLAGRALRKNGGE